MKTKCVDSNPPRLIDTILANAKHKRFLTTGEGRGFWMVCDRPFADAATDMLRDAIRSNKHVPSVLSRVPTTT